MHLTLTTIASGLALTTGSALAQHSGAAAVHHAIHHAAHHHAALHHAAVHAAHQQDAKTDAKTKAKADASASGKLSVVSSESMDGEQDGKVIELRVEDGKVTVKRNGKEIPQDRIRHEDDGRIIILDENGKELDDVHLFHGGHAGQIFKGGAGQDGLGGMYRFNVGEGLRLNAGQGVDRQGNLLWLGDENGEAPKVMLGVHMGEPGAALEKHLRLDAGKTCIITGVFEGLPAEVAGLGEHDIIVKIDDSDSADAGSIRKILTGKNPGDTCTLHVIQAGKAKDLKVKLQAYDAEKLGSAKLLGKDAETSLWRSLQPLNDLNVDLKAFENLPQLRDRVFVSPDSFKSAEEWKNLLPRLHGAEMNMEDLQPQIQKALQDALKNYEGAISLHKGEGGGDAKSGNEDVENQLDRLDKRMEQLEQMLQKLLERQPKP